MNIAKNHLLLNYGYNWEVEIFVSDGAKILPDSA